MGMMKGVGWLQPSHSPFEPHDIVQDLDPAGPVPNGAFVQR
jgi:hypothetical protein